MVAVNALDASEECVWEGHYWEGEWKTKRSEWKTRMG